MSAIPYCDDVLDRSVSLLQMVDVGKVLDLPIARVHQLLRDGQIIAVRRDTVLGVPEVFFDPGRIVNGLPGLLAVLRDGGYEDIEILTWLFAEDDSLPGTPIDAMHGDLMREVIRRAQAMAF